MAASAHRALSERPCHHCGEKAERHYAGLLACRQGRTFFKPALELAL